jgi:dolichyl-phosphate beta-glucosyltransferase
MKQIYLSVVIPCFDEMANLRKGVLSKVEHFLSKQKYNYEVIVVDDGSKDGSVGFIKKLIHDYPQFSLICSEHLGKAGAVTKGVLQAKGTYILFTDMDQATPIEEIEKILPYFDKFDIVIGSRNTKREGAPLSRQIVSRGALILKKLIIGMGDISDTQCGFKAFKHDVANIIFPKIANIHHGYKIISGSAVTAGFDMELLFLALKWGYKIKEVSVSWMYVETRRVSPVHDSIEGLRDLLIIKKNNSMGKYDRV